ncbi:10337_t:CDS:2, partial [Rhizophagus irregularis]
NADDTGAKHFPSNHFQLWNVMEVTVDDISFALRDEAIKQLYEFEKDMLKVEFKVIRDEQLKEL